jgi:long-chain acyl-CoA synthetase
MGVIDSVGNIFIRGRIKNMLLSGSGQNIYPEEIESEVCNLPYVLECVVVQREHRLIALTYPDRDAAIADGLMDDAAIMQHLENHKKELNRHFPVYAQVNAFELMENEFEKTPKKSIKRFLYK